MRRNHVKISRWSVVLGAWCILGAFTHAQAQRSVPAAPKTAREQAPIDLTGYWISVVTQDWRWRMLTPAKGDYASVPLNAEGRKLADAWDPAKDEAAGNQCKAYGAAAIMRVPGRLHISWRDDQTLQIDTEAGGQTRLVHFRGSSAPRGDKLQWQGDSSGQWEIVRGGSRFQARGAAQSGDLKVVTTHMRPGYLRKNGVPYGGKTGMTEYFDVTMEPNGWRSLLLTTVIEDPEYLTQTFLLTTPFRMLPDASVWNPTPCTAR